MLYLYIFPAFLGLLIGSFLNVVIFRIPNNKTFLTPRSHCIKCKKIIPFWCNIPILSYILLKGKCHFCKTKIPILYPTVEILSSISSIFIISHFGINPKAIAILILTWTLITLSVIDFIYLILPDIITLPFIWIGLLLNSFNIFTTPSNAIIGSIFGYCILWVFSKIFYKIKHTEGMGHGDYKLLSLFGAWFGWHPLLFIILLSSILCLTHATILILAKRYSLNQKIAFGPYLSIAGFISIFIKHNSILFFTHM